jgi:hypothetical protein
VLVNDDLQCALGGLQAILAAERLRRSRSEPTIGSLAERLLADLAKARI